MMAPGDLADVCEMSMDDDAWPSLYEVVEAWTNLRRTNNCTIEKLKSKLQV